MNAPERKIKILESDLQQKTVLDLKREAFDKECKLTSVKFIYQGKLMSESNKLKEFSKCNLLTIKFRLQIKPVYTCNNIKTR
jgi:hypothetical protein